MLGQSVALCRGLCVFRVRKFVGVLVSGASASAFFAQITLADGTGNNNNGNNNKTGWGIGVAADFDVGGKRITKASIVNGLARVNDTSGNVGVGFVLEAHYFFRDWPIPFVRNGCTAAAVKLYLFPCTDPAIGPFVAIEVGGGSSSSPAANAPITAFALEGMVGFRHLDPSKVANKNTTSSWNFGIGLRVDPRAQVLGDGFSANQPPPPGETAIRYKTEPRYGIILLSSFSF